MRGITRRKLTLAALGASFGLFARLPLAAADATPAAPYADVMVLHGTNTTPCDKPKIDLPLKYSCYEQLRPLKMTLVKGQSATAALPNGRTFQLVLDDILPADGKNPKRYKVAASVSHKDHPGFRKLADITAEKGKLFHVGGFPYQGGALILAITIREP